MSRIGSLFRNRIALALLGILIVGGGGAYWAVTSAASPPRQASNSLTNADSTSTASAEDPTATTDPGATATATTLHNTPTPRPTATPCVATPTPLPINQGIHWQGGVVNVSATSFVLRVGCGRSTITVNSATTWPGQAKSLSDMSAGWVAEVEAISQGGGTYLATLVNAQRDN
jgi:hypothetical protein